MGTPFLTIYEAFLNKITDFDLSYMTDDEMEYFCHSVLMSALVNIKPMEHKLDFDDGRKSFTEELAYVEIEVIACLMVYEWYQRQINTSMITKQFIGTKDEKFFAQANHLEKLSERAERLYIRARKLRRNYMYEVTEIK